MRKLYINNQLADLPADEIIEIIRRSNIFNFEKLQGSFSVDFTLPYEKSPRNQVVFGFVGEVGVKSEVKELPFSLVHNGIEVASGTCVAEQSDDNIDAYFLIDNGLFGDKIKEKPLRDHFPTALEINTSQLEYNEDADDFAFVLFGNEALHDNTFLSYTDDETKSQLVASVNVVANGKILTSDDDYTDGTSEYNYVNSPQIFIKPLLKNIFNIYDFVLESTFFELEEFANSAIFSPYDINQFGFNVVEVERNLEPLLYAGHTLPDMELKEFLLQLCGFYNASIIFKPGATGLYNGKVQIKLNNDIINSQEYENLPPSFTITSVEENETDGYEIELEAPDNDKYYENWHDLSAISYQEEEFTEPDFDEYWFFGPATVLAPKTDFYLNTLNNYLYGPGEDAYDFAGLTSRVAKPILETRGTDLQPIRSGELGFQHTVKAAAFGTRESDLACEVPSISTSYETSTHDVLRFGFVLNNYDANGVGRFSAENDSLNLHDWQKEVNGTSFFARCWADYLIWVQQRKAIEAEISGDEAFLFLQKWNAAKKYRDNNGHNYIFNEVVASYAQDKVIGVKVKGWTVW